MTKTKLANIVRQLGRPGPDGKRADVWYYRVGHGPRHRLPGEYGSAEFMAEYAKRLAGEAAAPGKASRPETIAFVVAAYLASRAFRDRQPSTRQQRELYLRQLVLAIGEERYADLDRAVIKRAMDRRPRAAANHLLKAVKALAKFAVEEGLAAHNPCEGLKGFRKPASEDPEADDGYHEWTPAECQAFEAAYPLGTRARLLYEVLLETGARVSDAIRLGRQHVAHDAETGLDLLTFRAKKNRVEVQQFISPRLKAALAAGPAGDMVWIVGGRGQPYDRRDSASDFMRQACDRIGLTECSPHGLRKRAASKMAEAGATERELMQSFGWTDAKMAAYYTRKASKKALALRAFARLNPSHPSQNPSPAVLPFPTAKTPTKSRA